jgi:hypothetical protein
MEKNPIPKILGYALFGLILAYFAFYIIAFFAQVLVLLLIFGLFAVIYKLFYFFK